ncbi:MAG TPA: hypothetical protein VGG09_09930 [Acidimicrobiales bacterium]|jgi:hypothetical protein
MAPVDPAPADVVPVVPFEGAAVVVVDVDDAEGDGELEHAARVMAHATSETKTTDRLACHKRAT